jgi:uncharacterized membrane protein YkvA (DUF1232 family)
MMKPPKDIEKYQEHYDEKKFGIKLPKVARKAGSKLVYAVLLLYYVLRSPMVSKSDKTKIYGALGYFLLPLDIFPDFIPMAGYTDDLTAVIWALHTVWKNITPEVKAQAAAKTREWFGDFNQAAADEQMTP